MMTETAAMQSPEVVRELIEAEARRARKLTRSAAFARWVAVFRRRYIVNGFLAPLYARDGRYSRPGLRVSTFGDYILPSEAQGKMCHDVSPGWVRNEEAWFWSYLADGQEVMSSRIPIPDVLKIDGVPADSVWPEIMAITQSLGLYQEHGGGFILLPEWVDEGWLADTERAVEQQEGEDGYLESYKPLKTPNWITLFHNYKGYRLSADDIEVRPAWFHLANYAFFNTPIPRLPVFYGLLAGEGRLDTLHFLDGGLSARAREYIGKAVLDMPARLKRRADIDASVRESREMSWWLWRKVGHRDVKRVLTYGEIADIAGASRSTIQTAVARFNRQLKDNMDRHLLGRLLRTAARIGLGHNLAYQALREQGLVPARERGIDSFDDLDNLI